MCLMSTFSRHLEGMEVNATSLKSIRRDVSLPWDGNDGSSF